LSKENIILDFGCGAGWLKNKLMRKSAAYLAWVCSSLLP